MRLPVLEIKVVEAGKLEARLQQSEQDNMAHNQEATQLHKRIQEAKAKWAEIHDTVLTVAERESAFEEQMNNFKAALSSKTKEANTTEKKRVRLEERLKRPMDQKRPNWSLLI